MKPPNHKYKMADYAPMRISYRRKLQLCDLGKNKATYQYNYAAFGMVMWVFVVLVLIVKYILL